MLTVQAGPLRWLQPPQRPFYTTTLVLTELSTGRVLVPYEDYLILHTDDEWSSRTQREMAHFVVLINPKLTDRIQWVSQVLGGDAPATPTIEQLDEFLSHVEGALPTWGEAVSREVVDPNIEVIQSLTDKVTFQYLVEQTEHIRLALLYGDAEHHDELMAYAVDTRARYIARIQELMQVARDAIAAHRQNRYAHTVTKAQIELPSVENYPIAPRLVLEAGVADRYLLTPNGLSVMLGRFILDPIQEHLDNAEAHAVTPQQLDLGSVDNYPVANPTEAQLGRRKDRLMTPAVTLGALNYQFVSRLQQHQLDSDAHYLSPYQLGLGNLENYPRYTVERFDDAATVEDEYLTPSGLNALIRHHYYDDQLSHVESKANPHVVTKETIGLPSVTNLSRDDYDGYYVGKNHSHTAETLPFTQEELTEWNDVAAWVLDSRVTRYEVDKVIWDELNNKKTGSESVFFPDPEANKLVQTNTVLKAYATRENRWVTRPGTAATMLIQEPPAEMDAPARAVKSLELTIGPQRREKVLIPGVPDSAWPMHSVKVQSLEPSKSNLINTQFKANVWRETNGQGGFDWYFSERILWMYILDQSLSSLRIQMDLEYDYLVPGTLVHRYAINHGLIWDELQRRFPPLNYTRHQVIATVYYLMELPEYLKGPEGVYFRGGNHYPYLRAQSTTANDIGLGQYPSLSEAEWDETLAVDNHGHPDAGYTPAEVFEELLKPSEGAVFDLQQAVNKSIINQIRSLDNTGYVLTRDGFEFTRYPYIPFSGFEYTATHWRLVNVDSNMSSRSFIDQQGSGITRYTFPEIGVNTGVWRLTSRHEGLANGAIDDRQEAVIEFDTGTPKNPWAWAMAGFQMLGRSLGSGGMWRSFPTSGNGSWHGNPSDGGLEAPLAAVNWVQGTAGIFTSQAEQVKQMALKSVEVDSWPDERPRAILYLNQQHPGWDEVTLTITRDLANINVSVFVPEIAEDVQSVMSALLTSNEPDKLDVEDANVTSAFGVDGARRVTYVANDVRAALGGYADPEPLSVSITLTYKKYIA
jgi:hypothetical protein